MSTYTHFAEAALSSAAFTSEGDASAARADVLWVGPPSDSVKVVADADEVEPAAPLLLLLLPETSTRCTLGSRGELRRVRMCCSPFWMRDESEEEKGTSYICTHTHTHTHRRGGTKRKQRGWRVIK